ncbi:DUF4245 domain-containing protein [Curtobacterium sp. MCBD17_034]|uniref:DUF4245 domain-containing protein n=1 Tax=unclassified Curtobacterium TaxID=257496 RepID=UPI000DA925DD|nr:MULTISPECIES: DUF4245 domain-containing protein [unclassified Curtobacterium]PZF58021.1 DUF4245 domain-containing protein [Curtobacterium sp. MCBD17_034]PZM33213.1 DUF4245 domain-containing protein [Curtobacterium sp. MCBD17_031]
MSDQHPQSAPVVAELGRPETAEETRIRKEDARRVRRQHQTALNLVLSLAASLAVVLALVAIVARPDHPSSTSSHVDYRSVAAQADVPHVTLAAPRLPSGYSANRADFQDDTADGVDVWTVGLITPDDQYIGVHQGIRANQTWVANQLDEHAATGSRTIDGTKWAVYDRRDEGKGAGNEAYSLVATFGASTVVLAGTADDASFRTVAHRIATQLEDQNR